MSSNVSLVIPPDRDHHSMPALACATPVDQLGDAIAELAARLHAATYQLLVLLRQFDAARGWNTGFLSCAHWLSWRTGIDPGAAREKVRVARALAGLPRIGAAMQRGELSYSKVRALTRVATPACEAQLLEIARAGTASQVEQVVRAWRRADRAEAARLTEQRHRHRCVSTWVDEDGMLVIRGRLTPEVGAVVQRALEAAADQLFRESAQAAEGGSRGSMLDVGRRRRTVPPAIRRALEARDRHCRFPGCTARRCDVHHIAPWAHGGTTSLANTLLVCRRHHRLVHEGGYTVVRASDGTVTFVGPDGIPIEAAPAPPRWADRDARPLGPTSERLAAGGHTVGSYTATPCWQGERLDAVWAVDVLRGARRGRSASAWRWARQRSG